LDIQQLRFFQAIIVHKRLTTAARKLHISEPALSQSIKRLENELGVELFDRVGRNIVLNEYGKIFNKHVTEVLYSLRNAQAELENLAGKDSNSVTICWNYSGYMEKLLLQYIDDNPHISVNQYQVPEELINEELLKPYCDFVIGDPDYPENSSFKKLLFPDLKWYLAIPSDHPLANDPSPRLAQFADDFFSVISLTPGHMLMTQSLCERAGFKCKIAYRASPNVCIDLVIEKKRLTFVNEDMARMAGSSYLYADKIKFIQLSEEDCALHNALMWNGKKKLSKAAQGFLDYMHIRAAEIDLPQ